MNNIKNIASWQGDNPLTLRVTGTGEYVMSFLCDIVKHFEDIVWEKEQKIRGDIEYD